MYYSRLSESLPADRVSCGHGRPSRISTSYNSSKSCYSCFRVWHAKIAFRHEILDSSSEIEALGALKLLLGGSASLAAVDDLHQATGRDLNLVVGQKHSATVGGDMQERIEGLRRSVAGVSQRMQSPKNWIGSVDVNLFKVVCDTLDLLQEMNSQLAVHTHGPTPTPTPVPGNASAFASAASVSSQLSAKLSLVTL